jgi:hypothetical protein
MTFRPRQTRPRRRGLIPTRLDPAARDWAGKGLDPAETGPGKLFRHGPGQHGVPNQPAMVARRQPRL